MKREHFGMSTTSARMRLRAVLDGNVCVQCPSIFDPISARIAAAVGFEVGILGGSVVSMLTLGAPDCNVITLTELVEQARRICRAIDLPLIVDADSGYGNALNVMRAVEELEAIGAAAITIEDSNLPRPCGKEPPALIPVAEMATKLRAALAARRDGGFAIIARTSALGCRCRAELLERLAAYEAVGADALCVVGVEDRPTMNLIASTTSLPILLIAYGETVIGDAAYLAEHHVRLHLQGHRAFEASLQAIHESLLDLRNGKPAAPFTSRDLVARVADTERYKRRVDDFLCAGDAAPH